MFEYEGREQQDIRGYRGADTVAIGGHMKNYSYKRFTNTLERR